MMAVLQSYQVESCSKIWIRGRDCLLMRSIWALWVTKQTATAIGIGRRLWLNLADNKEKEKAFLLNVPVLLSELFGTSVKTAVRKYREIERKLK